MMTLKLALALGTIGSTVVAVAPASAIITTFANYSGVGGANMFWQRSGTNYVVTQPVVVKPVVVTPVVVKPVVVALKPVPVPIKNAKGVVTNQAAINAANQFNATVPAMNAANVVTANATNAANVVTANRTNAANVITANATNAANVVTANNATAASAASARATAGGSLYTIATPTSTTAGTVATKFTFLTPSPTNPLRFLTTLGALNAAFTFDASSTAPNPVITGGGFDIQPLTSGSFSFIYTGTADLRVGHTTYHTGANLLSATFTGGGIAGLDHSTSGSATDSTGSGGTIVYTSDFLNFIRTTAKDFSIAGSSITVPNTRVNPGLSFTANQALNTFKTTTTGSFSTDPAPSVLAVVPEPGVWMLMVAGFGLVGVSARRRGRSVAA